MDKTLPPINKAINEEQRMAQMRRERMKIAAWLETRRGKPQYRPAPAAGRAVARVVKPLSKKFSGRHSAAHLIPHWPSIMGEKWAKFSRPEKFTGDKNGKTLIIGAPGPAATLIMASAGMIIERVNIFMGEGAVTSIRVIQKKMTPSQTIRQNSTSEQAQNRSNRPHDNRTGGQTDQRIGGVHPPRGLTPQEEDHLQSGLKHIEEQKLRTALAKLGRNVISRNSENTP